MTGNANLSSLLRRTSAWIAAVCWLGISALSPRTANAYTNSSSGNWSVSGSWSGSPPPVGGAANAVIVLQPSSGALVATNDLAGTFTLNQLSALANTVSLYGNAILFTNNGAALPLLTNNSGSPLTLCTPITLGANTTFGDGGNITNKGVISGSGNVTLVGAGTLTLFNTNLYTGNTTVSGGKLRLVAPGSIYDAGYTGGPTVTVTNNGIIEFDNWAYGPATSFGDLDFGSSRIVVNGGTLRCVAANGTSGGRSLTVGAAGGTLDSSVSNATWHFGYSSTYPNMPINGLMTLTGAGNGEIDQHLTGSGSVTMNGSGSWTLAGTNSYLGATTVNAGSLVVNGSINSQAAMTVAAGGSLYGNGLIASVVTVNHGGSVAPGAATGSAGHLIFSGTLALGGGCTLNFGLGGVGASDCIVLTGAYVTPASPVAVTISNLNYSCNSGTYQLITGAAGISASSFVLTSMPQGFSGTLSATNGTLFLTVVASPSSQTSALGVPGTVGSALSYQITLVSNATSYAAAGLPPGLSLNSGTGLISGTPTNAGIYWAAITATSAAGSGSSQLVFVLTPMASGSLASPNHLPLVVTNSGTTTAIQPWPDNTLLINPGKGYAEYWGPTTQYTRDIIGVGYNRCHWSDLEPSEGVYNWNWIDSYLAAYAAYGRKFAFGVINTDCGTPYATPQWVFQPGTNSQTGSVYPAGAVPKSITDPCNALASIVIPSSWDDPVYLARMKEFITAFGARYNGNPSIAFLDERDYGLWGEGNGGFPGATQASPGSTQTNYYAPYVQAFPNTQLLEDAWYGSVESWLVSQGTGTRRDGICSGSGNGSPCLVAYPYHPVVMEYWGMATNVYRGGPENELLIYVTGGRPSYLQFNGDGLYPTRTNFYQMIGNLIGYHFVLQQATIPNSIQAGVSFPLSFTWFNDGVAPLLQPCSVAVALLDTNNNLVQQQWLTGSNPNGWMPGCSTTEVFTNVSFSSVPAGYKLAVGLFLNQNDATPTYRLGIQGRTVTGWYLLSGTVTQASAIWTNAAGGSWQNSSNWTGSSLHSGMDVTADFSTLNLASNATVTLDGAVTAGNLLFGDAVARYNWLLNSGVGGTLTLNVSPGAPTPSIAVNNQTATINAALLGNAGLVKSGSGTLVLAGPNSFHGNALINGGALEVGSSTRLYSLWSSATTVSIAAGGTLRVNGWGGYGNGGLGELDQVDMSNPNALLLDGGTLEFAGAPNGNTSSARAFSIGVGGATLRNASSQTWDLSASGGGVYAALTNNSNLTLAGIGPSSFLDKNLGGAGSLTKNGTGTWKLRGTNTYTGNTLISAGTLALASTGSFSNSPLISLGSGATLDVSAAAFNLQTSQTLANIAATALVAGSLNTGSGRVSLTYAAGTPSLMITNGTLTLSSNTVFAVKNAGASMAAGSYKLIARATTGQAGLVTGTVPASVSMGGGGTPGGAALQIVGGELYLQVGGNSITGLSLSNGPLGIITAYGIFNYSYILQRATNLVPAAWSNIATNIAASNGLVSLSDYFSNLGSNAPGAAFYRLQRKP